jgi:hypothetical protein
MSFMTNSRQLCNAVLVAALLLTFFKINAQCETITLSVDHKGNELLVPDGYYMAAIINEIDPEGDIRLHELGTSTELMLDLEEPGVYTFTAQTIICEVGSDCSFEGDGMYDISDDSEPVDYILDTDSPEDADEASNDGETSDDGGASGGCFIFSAMPK